MNENWSISNKLSLLAVVILIGILIGFWRAYVLLTIWRWFWVPIGYPDVPLVPAWAMFVIIASFIRHPTLLNNDDKSNPVDKIVNSFVSAFMEPLLILVMARVVYELSSHA